MAEVTVQFKNAINGYNKEQVDAFLKNDIEERLQKKSAEIASLTQKVSELEAKLESVSGGDETVGEKLNLYEKLMEKMNGDYENLLAPAVAKAKAIEEASIKECEIRMSQVQTDADGIYAVTSEKIAEEIAGAVNSNLDRFYGLMDEYIHSRTIPVRIAKTIYNLKNNLGNFKTAVGNVVKKKLKK